MNSNVQTKNAEDFRDLDWGDMAVVGPASGNEGPEQLLAHMTDTFGDLRNGLHAPPERNCA